MPRYNGGQDDITFEAATPRGVAYLVGLQNRARLAELHEPGGTLGEGWNVIEQTVNVRKYRAVPAWAVHGIPQPRPLAPVRAQRYANYTTLGLWQQLQKK
jgi:hypothetical protein